MNKILLGAIGALALSLSAPASAADLAARPYTKAPAPMVAAIYDWSGFYIGINGGGGTSHKCWDSDFVRWRDRSAPTAATTRPAARSVVSSAIAWQSGDWVFGVEGQGNWADFSGDNDQPR